MRITPGRRSSSMSRGSPGALTYIPGEFGITIPNDLIEDHYAKLSNAS